MLLCFELIDDTFVSSKFTCEALEEYLCVLGVLDDANM
jgi:hypothetical protein